MYVAAGHLTVDIQPDGRRRAGGTVLFGALAAVLSGRRAHIITTAADDIDALLPDLDGLTVDRSTATETTTFVSRGADRERVQELRSWAGQVPPRAVPVTAGVLHLAPVARELAPAWLDEADDETFIVLTPQGLVRDWPEEPTGGRVILRQIDAAWARDLRRRIVLVLNAVEVEWVGDLADRTVAVGGTVVVTDGHRPALVRTRGRCTEVPTVPIALSDDTGAGDVFAAAIGLALSERAKLTAAVQQAHATVAELLPRIHALLPVAGGLDAG